MALNNVVVWNIVEYGIVTNFPLKNFYISPT